MKICVDLCAAILKKNTYTFIVLTPILKLTEFQIWNHVLIPICLLFLEACGIHHLTSFTDNFFNFIQSFLNCSLTSSSWSSFTSTPFLISIQCITYDHPFSLLSILLSYSFTFYSFDFHCFFLSCFASKLLVGDHFWPSYV